MGVAVDINSSEEIGHRHQAYHRYKNKLNNQNINRARMSCVKLYLTYQDFPFFNLVPHLKYGYRRIIIFLMYF